MKILLINKFHYPRDGVTKYHFTLAKLLEAHGHRVAIFSTNHPQNLPTPWSRYFPDYLDLNGRYSLFEKARIANKVIYNWEARRKLRALLDVFKPDIAHLQNIYYHLTPSIIDELYLQGIPMVMTLHDYQLISPQYTLFSRGAIWEKSKKHRYYQCVLDACVRDSYVKSIIATLEAYCSLLRRSYRKVNLFIAPSRFLKEKFLEYGFSGTIEIMNNPVSLPSENIGDTIPRWRKKDYVLYYGRLSSEKGVELILQALAIGKDFHLNIAGQGPDRARLETLVREQELESNVEFLGFQSGQDLERLIYEAKAVIVPSLWYENYPYAVSESLARGKVVIASRIGGIPELIDDKQNGFLFEPSHSRELRRIITHLADYNLVSIAKNARKSVANLDPELWYQRLLTMYKNLTFGQNLSALSVRSQTLL